MVNDTFLILSTTYMSKSRHVFVHVAAFERVDHKILLDSFQY